MKRRMPVILIILLVLFGLPLAQNIIFAVRCAITGSYLGLIIVAPILIPGLLIVIGLWRGSRIAWHANRILILIFLIAFPLLLLGLAIKGVQLPIPWWAALLMVVPYVLALVTYLMLGHQTVRQYCSIA